jgi:hypothetical protein
LAHYLVKASFLGKRLDELWEMLADGRLGALKPFGKALDYSLRNARYLLDEEMVCWEEEDYCNPPLAMEREQVLDRFFEIHSTERVEKDMGWARIGFQPRFWILARGLPNRSGEKPRTRRGMPHSQLSQNPSPSIYEALADLLFSIPDVREDVSLVSVPGARALVLDGSVSQRPSDAFMAEGEFAHLHPPHDSSLHLMTPPNWLHEVLEKGWGEKHPLAGVAIPETAVMIYAPRNSEEIDIVYNIVLLSYWRAKGYRIPSPREVGE